MFPITALNQNASSKDGIAIISETMRPRPADRMNVSTALLHPWTCVQKHQSTADSLSELFKQISIADLQLRTSNVSNYDNERSYLDLGTSAMPQTPKDRNLNNLESKDADVPSAGIETAGNELDRHKKKLGLQKQVIETQKRELDEEHPTTLRPMENLALKLASTETRYNYKMKRLRRKSVY